MSVSLVRQQIFSSAGFPARVDVQISERELPSPFFLQQTAIRIHGLIDALDVHILGLGGGNLEGYRFKRTHFRNNLQEERQHASAKAWPAVSLAPFLLVLSPGKMVEKFSLAETRRVTNDFLAARQQCHAGHFRNDLAD